MTVRIPSPESALPGRDKPIVGHLTHHISGAPLDELPAGAQLAMFAMGCFWGAEKLFWQASGVRVTAVGYAGGSTPNPTYEEVCSGRTGHAEVVRLAYDPGETTFEQLLALFWEGHDPTQGMRQGNDIGTQYRSGIYTYSDERRQSAERSLERYQAVLAAAGLGHITTEILPAGPFYFAERYHQQYLAKNPNGYCGLGGTGLALPRDG
jgi:peptide-methionine (S)-S-oxide reductase